VGIRGSLARLVAAAGAVFVAVPSVAVAPSRPALRPAAAARRSPDVPTAGDAASGGCGAGCGIRLAINIYDTTQLRFVVDDEAPLIEPGDVFVLVSGNNGNALSTSWLNGAAATLQRAFPANTIDAYTAGVQNVAAVASGTTSAISGVLYGYEPGMGNEPEFSWDAATTEREMATAATAATRDGKQAGSGPTGRPLLEPDLQQYGWNYGRLSAPMGLTIVQTQTWAKQGGSSLARALGTLAQEYAGTSESWMPQLTVDATDPNGITAEAAYTDTLTMEADGLSYVSIWWSDATSSFAAYLSMLRGAGAGSTAPGHPVSVTRIYGATADATAAAELSSAYPSARGVCPGSPGDRPVVLATDGAFPDALSSSYLAGALGTGTLLTPTAALSAPTRQALEDEGITHVVVVGGPLAVSTSVVRAIEATSVTACGGGAAPPGTISVTRIFGQTATTTAAQVATTPGPGVVGSLDLAGAYAAGDPYDATAGTSSAAPSVPGPVRTAILATAAGFQDAEAAATLSYADHLPLLLTGPASLSQAADAGITSLGVRQVLLMGGPLAVSTAVVHQLEGQGISVLRVAGADDTQTATELADLELAPGSSDLGAGWSPTGGLVVARGDFYADGLAGAVVAAAGEPTGTGPEPMLLTESPSAAGPHLTSALTQAGAAGVATDGTVVGSLTVLGGPLAVTTTTLRALEADLG
jgi:putative cell wall-binding protein